MIAYRTLEPPSAVLSAWLLPVGGLPGERGDAAAAPRALLHRLDRVTVCAPCGDGAELQRDWLLPGTAAAVVPLPQRGLALAVGVQPGGGCAVVELEHSGTPAAPHHQQQQEQRHAGSGHCGGYARVVAEAQPDALQGSCTREGAALEDASALASCVCSPPLTLGGGGGGGDASGGCTYVLAGGAHGILQLATWWHPAVEGGAPSAGGGEGGAAAAADAALAGRLAVTAFRAAPALLAGGLPDLRARSSSAADLAAIRAASITRALLLLPECEQALLPLGGGPLAAVLHEVTGPDHSVVHLHCVELHAPSAAVLRGPWSLCNLHPTTCLLRWLAPAAGCCGASGGVLAISGRGTLLVARSSAAAGAASTSSGAGAPPSYAKVDLARWELQGAPLAAEAVGGGGRVLVVADSAAGLHILDLSGPAPVVTRVTTAVPLSLASALCFMPLGGGGGGAAPGAEPGGAAPGLAGVLLLTSDCGSTQALGVPPLRLGAAAAAAPATAAWPVLRSALLPSLAPVMCVAPIPAGAMAGAPEAQVVVGCGRAPRGRLARLRSGEGVSLFPVAGDAAAPGEHSLLLISLEGAARGTVALALAGGDGDGDGGGGALRQLEAPGIDAASPTLWAGGAPGGWAVQATPGGLRVAGPAPGWPLAHEWRGAHGPLTLAAGCGPHLAFASGGRVATLRVAPGDGGVALLAEAELPQQASALAAFAAPPGVGGLLLAVGLWVDNAVLLMAWPSAGGGGLAAVARLELGEQQPRSLAALDVAGRTVLLAGTSQGQVISWELAPGPSPAAPVAARAARRTRIGSTAVTLQASPAAQEPPSDAGAGAGAYVYAHCDADAVFAAAPHAAGLLAGGAPLAATDAVRASRVIGGEGLRAACPLHAARMPHSLAWVSPGGRLCLGALDGEHRLRWAVARLGDTPLAAAWHGPSGCVAVLTEAEGGDGGGCGERRGRQAIRLLEGRGLRQVAALQLGEGHVATAAQVLALPCTSGGAAGGSGAGAAAAAAALGAAGDGCSSGGSGGGGGGTWPFLVVASYLAAGRGGAPAGAAPQPQPQPGPPTCEAAGRDTAGLLSFFDLRRTGAAAGAAAGGGAARHDAAVADADAAPGGGGAGTGPAYEVVLLGTVPLAGAPTSLCTAVPGRLTAPAPQPRAQAAERPRARAERARAAQELEPRGSEQRQEGAAAGGRGAPMLVVGGEAGLAAYRVAVDDAGVASAAAVEAELAAAAAVDELPGAGAGAGEGEGQGGAAQGEGRREEEAAAEGGWRQRVACTWAAGCAALARTCVTSLQALPGGGRGDGGGGDVVAAGEALGSVTLVRLAETPAGRALLLPLAADRTGALAVAAAPIAGPAPPGGGGGAGGDGGAEGCGLAGGGGALLLALHPCGLLRMCRDAGREQAQLEGHWRDAAAAYEAGHRAPPGAGWPDDGWAHPGAAWVGDGEARWPPAGARARGAAGRGPGAAGGAPRESSPFDLLRPDAAHAPPLLPVASARAPPGPSALCALRLGLVAEPADAGEQRQAEGQGEGPAALGAGAAAAPILCFTSAGGVCGVLDLAGGGDAERAAALQAAALQQQQERRRAAGASGDAADDGAAAHAPGLRLLASVGGPEAASTAALAAAAAARLPGAPPDGPAGRDAAGGDAAGGDAAMAEAEGGGEEAAAGAEGGGAAEALPGFAVDLDLLAAETAEAADAVAGPQGASGAGSSRGGVDWSEAALLVARLTARLC
ncbi:MAG: hypothetical protein J3K34DRAFT_516759 [Monoraphidium minutum]|nr:MAG: hypothetical protein J3K34DRAFT_516759 [Monoraphidium minutum]